MPAITLVSALMKARFASLNVTLDSVVPAPGSGPRVGAGLPMPAMGTLAANRPQTVSGNFAGNRPGVAGMGSSTPPPAPTGTPMPCPPALFRAATNHPIDCEYQKSMHDELNKFFDAIARGLSFGMSMWQTRAHLSGVRIIGPSAIGGKIEAPYIDPEIVNQTNSIFGGNMSGWASSLTVGVARGFANKWKEMGDKTMVPGLPWYPAFTAFPGPTTPWMPNIPTPFVALASQKWLISPGALKDEMLRKAPSGTLYADQVFTVVSEHLSTSLSVWMLSQQVMLVMGRGPVPSFAPPYVPVGPVVDGEIDPKPGHFMA